MCLACQGLLPRRRQQVVSRAGLFPTAGNFDSIYDVGSLKVGWACTFQVRVVFVKCIMCLCGLIKCHCACFFPNGLTDRCLVDSARTRSIHSQWTLEPPPAASMILLVFDVEAAP